MGLVFSKGLTLRKGWQPMDPDAAAYITAVETADDQALEEKTKIAIDNFVLGCKTDGIWNAIKASCILAGARTLAGALVPLVGTAPTNNNFVSGDYNRKTGLVGDGSTKYLNSNRNNNADPQDSKHLSIYASTPGSILDKSYIGMATAPGSSHLSVRTTPANGLSFRVNSSAGTNSVMSGLNAAGFIGVNRPISSFCNLRGNKTSVVETNASASPSSGNVLVFDGLAKISARLAFYSIGESLDLALLDARVTDLINAFGAAIP